MLRLFSACLLVFAVAACGDSAPQDSGPVNIIDFTDPNDPRSCIQSNFPADQPNLSIVTPPRFLLTTSQAQQSTNGQAVVRSGDPVLAEVTVNGSTRQVFVELADVWDPRVVLASLSTTTPGNETIPLEILPDVPGRGRYYLRLTLCGDDCDDEQVVFEAQPCVDDIPDAECAHNVPYLRTVVKDRVAEEPQSTCIDLGGYQGYGSGTVLIQ